MSEPISNIARSQEVVRIVDTSSEQRERKPNFREIPTVSSSGKEERMISQEEINKILDEINKFISLFNTRITFEVDDITGRIILKIVEMGSDKVIRQIPPEELLKVSRKIAELIGLIIDERI
jgi:flagellar protein FlaG